MRYVRRFNDTEPISKYDIAVVQNCNYSCTLAYYPIDIWYPSKNFLLDHHERLEFIIRFTSIMNSLGYFMHSDNLEEIVDLLEKQTTLELLGYS